MCAIDVQSACSHNLDLNPGYPFEQQKMLNIIFLIGWISIALVLIWIVFVTFCFRLYSYLQYNEIRKFDILVNSLCCFLYLTCNLFDLIHVIYSYSVGIKLNESDSIETIIACIADGSYFFATFFLLISLIGRAHMTFNDTIYQLQKISLLSFVFALSLLFLLFLNFAYLYTSVIRHILTKNSKENTLNLSAILFICLMSLEIFISLLISYLFLKNMHQLVAARKLMHLEEESMSPTSKSIIINSKNRKYLNSETSKMSNDSNDSNDTNDSNDGINNYNSYNYNLMDITDDTDMKLINVITKYTIISIIALTSGTLWYWTKLYRYVILAHSTQFSKTVAYSLRQLELVICLLCVFLTFTFNNDCYESICQYIGLHKWCQKCCIRISNRNVNNKVKKSNDTYVLMANSHANNL